MTVAGRVYRSPTGGHQFENGEITRLYLAAVGRSAILNIVSSRPTDADLLKNPLGVYVHALDWSKEFG